MISKMYDLICHLYFYLKRYQKEQFEVGKTTGKIYSLLIIYCEWILNVFVKKMYLKFPSKRRGINKDTRIDKVIISLTSYPKRITTVWLTIESLLRQSYKPDKIILWLSRDQFPKGKDSLPSQLKKQQDRGLEIKFVSGDLKSHKKYYYALQEYSEANVILVDDDTFYQHSLVKNLMKLHKKYPKDIVCMTAFMITNLLDVPSLWHYPMKKEKVVSSIMAQAFTGSGTLIPPNSVDEKYCFDKKLIEDLCPYADDLWIKYMSMRKGTKVTVKYPFHSFSPVIDGTSVDSLWYINGQDKQNDVQWEALNNYFATDISYIQEVEYEI